MLQLLFTCRCMVSQTDAQIEAFQRDVWRRCEDREIGGFFLRSGERLIGLFEGREKHVVGQVEHLIRNHKVGSVRVVREVSIEKREWKAWNSDLSNLTDWADVGGQKFAGLAQIVEIAVNADRRGSQPH